MEEAVQEEVVHEAVVQEEVVQEEVVQEEVQGRSMGDGGMSTLPRLTAWRSASSAARLTRDVTSSCNMMVCITYIYLVWFMILSTSLVKF